MNSGIVSTNHIEYTEPKFSSITKWTRFISIIYFINAVIFFAASCIPFFIKRTEGFDPYFISGAHSGTIQLLLFVLINIVAVISFLLGYYLIKFSFSFHNSEGILGVINGLEPALAHLKSFFKIFGIIILAFYIIGVIALLI